MLRPGVRVSLLRPKLDTSFDTIGIEAGVQFLYVKAPICKGFPILFNDNRLYGDSEMVTVEPFSFAPPVPFNERSVGCANFSWGCAFWAKGCASFNYSSRTQNKVAKRINKREK